MLLSSKIVVTCGGVGVSVGVSLVIIDGAVGSGYMFCVATCIVLASNDREHIIHFSLAALT